MIQAALRSVPLVRRGGVLPGYRLALGFTVLYLGLLVLLPLGALVLKASTLSWDGFVAAVTGPRALAAYRLSFGAALAGAVVNALFGPVVAWVVLPALLTGFALAFARALGEYGSVVFISGNMPLRTEIVPLLIVTKLEQYDSAGATAIGVVMLGASFLLLLIINVLQARTWQGRAR